MNQKVLQSIQKKSVKYLNLFKNDVTACLDENDFSELVMAAFCFKHLVEQFIIDDALDEAEIAAYIKEMNKTAKKIVKDYHKDLRKSRMKGSN